jgi:cardiolipin synthase
MSPVRRGVARKLPNLLSLLRLTMVPAVVLLLIEERPGWAFATFSAAALLDAVDGWLARRFDGETAIGAYLDPLADKALMMSSFIVLGTLGWLPVWLVVVVVSRDAAILGGIVLSTVVGLRLEVAPLTISKVNTVVQGVLVAGTIALAAFGLQDWPPGQAARSLLAGLTAISTVVSGLAYGYGWARRALAD